MQRLSTTPAGESPTVSVRLPPDLLAVVDAEVARLNAQEMERLGNGGRQSLMAPAMPASRPANGEWGYTRGHAVRTLLREVVQLRAAATPGAALTRGELAPVLAALDGASARVRALLDAAPVAPRAEPSPAPEAPAPKPPRATAAKRPAEPVATPPGRTVRAPHGPGHRASPELLDALAPRVAAARAQGRTVVSLAELAGVARSSLARWVKDGTPLCTAHAEALAAALESLGA